MYTLSNRTLQRFSSLLANISKPTISKYFAHSSATRIQSPSNTNNVADDSLTCRLATPNDCTEIIEFMIQMFITREPLMKCVGATAVEARPFVQYHVEEALVDKASFVAVDNEDGSICGVRLNGLGPSSGHELQSDFGPKMNTINKFLASVETNVESIIRSKHFMRHVAICVKPDVVQRGVATELMKESYKYAFQKRLTHMVAVCSGSLPYKLAEKIGFTLAREIPYGDYVEESSLKQKNFNKNDCKIIKPFAKLADTHYAARLMVKSL